MITLASPFSYPLHVASWKRPSGSIDYRVTNSFTGPDLLNGGQHRATDAGNFRVNDSLRAPIACRAIGRRHTDGALGVLFELGGGITVQLWHLNRVSLPSDRWTTVARGQAVGVTGNTGARLPDGSAMPQHTHIEIKRNGVPFDPEPHLPMVERAAKPISIGEDDVKIRGRFVRHVHNARAALTTDAHFRSGDDWTSDSLGILTAGTLLYPVVVVEGRAVGTAPDKAEWVGALAYIASSYHFGYVHSSVLPRMPDGSGILLTAIQSADCSAVEAEVARLTNVVKRARTAGAGARQAIEAVEAALR